MGLRIDVHHYVHSETDSEVNKLLRQILNLNITMAKKIDEINASLDEINDATNNIAADLDRIAGGLEGGLSADEAQSVATRLTTTATTLRAIANRNPEAPTEPTPEP
jgi:methyl-accepting chemotaxis protein